MEPAPHPVPKKTRIRKKKPSGNGQPTKKSKPGCGLSCLPWTSFRLLWFEFLRLVSSMAGQPPTIDLTSASPSHDGIEDITPRVRMADTFRETASIARASPAPTKPPHLRQACQQAPPASSPWWTSWRARRACCWAVGACSVGVLLLVVLSCAARSRASHSPAWKAVIRACHSGLGSVRTPVGRWSNMRGRRSQSFHA